MLGLFNLELGEELDKPFKTFLVPVDPEEVDLGRKRVKSRTTIAFPPFSG